MQSQTNPFAVVSLVLGLIAFFADCILGAFTGLFGGCSGLLVAILAIVFGHVARSQIAASQGTQEGEGIGQNWRTVIDSIQISSLDFVGGMIL